MSANQNIEALAGQGEFHSRVPPSEPLTTKGHKPGVKVGNDAAPEFHAEAYAPGTAPRENTYQPNAQSEIPGQAQNPGTEASTGALDIPGATSGDVYNRTEFGKPVQGQTSSELHGSKKKDRTGFEGRAQPGHALETGDGSVEGKVRGLGADLEGRAGELKGQKGMSGGSEGGVNWQGADEKLPTSAEELAAELPKGGHAGVASSERA
ncbi:hypothetical protein VP1G_01665 [Cytospora mali]|uniref:Uncharacterized protein n=1 Tax=Cytospora mali TaxID=578113 RepID=A0A194URE5_CYTMA|nr:hypothetical protein VP1G_01665 [Valsa mali var. pyri (nom. inval.)]